MTSAKKYQWLAQSRTLLMDAYWPPFNPQLEFDAKRMVQAALSLGANTIRFGTAGKYALLPNPFFPEHPELGGRDLLKEALAETLHAGIRLIAYVPVSHGLPASLLTASRPGWALRLEDGTLPLGVQHFGGEPLLPCCPFGDYRNDILSFIRQVVERYPVNGLYLDGPYYDWNMESRSDICHCPSCARSYRDYCGKDLPDSPSLGAQIDPGEMTVFRNWVAEGLLGLLREINHIAKSKDLPLLFNAYSCANRPAEYEHAMLMEADGLLLETGMGGLRGVAVGKGMGKIVWRYTQPHHGYPRKSTLRQEADNARMACETVMWGGAPIVSYGGRFCCGASAETPLKKLFSWLEREQKFLDGAVPVAPVAVVSALRVGDRDTERNQALSGLYLALQGAGFTVDVLTADGIEQPGVFGKYGAVLAPCSCEALVAGNGPLAEYVRGGGMFVGFLPDAGGEEWRGSGLLEGIVRSASACADGPEQYWNGDWDAYCRPVNRPEDFSGAHGGVLLPHGKVCSLRGGSEWQTLAEFVWSGDAGTARPAVLARTEGQGRLIAFGFSLGQVYAEFPERETESFLHGLLRGSSSPTTSCGSTEQSPCDIRFIPAGAGSIQTRHLYDPATCREMLVLLNAQPGSERAVIPCLSFRFGENRCRNIRSAITEKQVSGVWSDSEFTVRDYVFDVFDVLELLH